MSYSTLMALSPLDGRYAQSVDALRPLASEYALMKQRLYVEVKWLITLSDCSEIIELPPFDESTRSLLNSLVENFSEKDAQTIKNIEKTTRHDVKAVEYFLAEKIKSHSDYVKIRSFIHFGCTSEDINNLAYALMFKEIRDTLIAPTLEQVIQQLLTITHRAATTPMLARTHGQTATPTTLGKEIANTVARLQSQLKKLNSVVISGKCNGAVGNFNAHYIAYPKVDWEKLAQNFVQDLGLGWNRYTTQIEPHDWIAEFSHALIRINTILIDLSRDTWGYISLGYFTQSQVEGEVGSSTMPHKINPIDFENAEGNLGLANALLAYFAEKLPISRWQRDLSDSTVLRNSSVAIGHSLLAYHNLSHGLNKLMVNSEQLAADLDNAWEVLAEAVQTVMRRYGINDAYEQLKDFTRGKQIDQILFTQFIESQPLPDEVKKQLKGLTPSTYLGIASKLANEI